MEGLVADLFRGESLSGEGTQQEVALIEGGTRATNVMSPGLSYTTATSRETAFNTLNMAYLREQVFYGN